MSEKHDSCWFYFFNILVSFLWKFDLKDTSYFCSL
uniref:Uncharacterized protein n=1 Tax=Rhizophora mucronata TaxID=61149 RepID=A0A2P2PBF1_RHIMU